MAVADFYNELMLTLAELGFEAKISGAPNEVEDATPFSQDTKHASYDRDAANRFWRVCCSSQIAFSNNFVRRSSANAVRCTSSGAASTSR